MARIVGIVRALLLPPGDLEPEQAIFRALCRVGAVLTLGVSVPVNR